MNILIRADSSATIGLGHILRCRTLALELAQGGAEILFACRDLPAHQTHLLAAEGFETVLLPPRSGGAPSEGEDAADTIRAVGDRRFDQVVVDHYGLSAEWEDALRARAGGMVVIDDLADRRHSCDILLDQNHFADPEARYAGLAGTARRLLGPDFALLDPSYRALAPRSRGGVRRVLLFFGGADAANITERALFAFSDPTLRHLQLDVVVGAANPHADAIAGRIAERGGATLHPMRRSLAPLMHDADLAVGAGGTSNWERLSSGLPSLVLSVAANQVAVCEALAAAGAIAYLGDQGRIGPESIAAAASALIAGPERLRALSDAGPLMVDGYGSARVAEAMAPTAKADMRLRPAGPRDAGIYYRWVNEPETRRHSLKPDAVGWPEHQAWFSARIASPESFLYVLETSHGLPVGQVRFDGLGDGAYRLSYSLDSLVRGRGLAGHLVEMGLARLAAAGARSVVAEVKADNARSDHVLRRLGFEPGPTRADVNRFTATLQACQ